MVNAELNVISADMIGEYVAPRFMQGTSSIVLIQVASKNETSPFEKGLYTLCDHFLGSGG